MGKLESEIKRMTAKRKAEVVMKIFQGKTTTAEVSRQYDLTPAQIEEWMEEARKGMENLTCPQEVEPLSKLEYNV